ncbi:hypothetical protein ACF5DM_004546 [Salmonella enterica]|nr:hypothetical protein [Salmonella enterica subsp. enterica serovar Nigeria]ECG8305608.1 hypothetical protein [Salmonella enterica subsp. enterica serovar Glostrup]ECG9331092.1 hypothetical protein [Salmonella enterica]ECY7871612.1 hypothetical protein [Salmonella enterica subsp. enterica serovar Wilhelmsburg]EDW4632794.1 hypothetical protein [Salmonella enterica subsp. enterica]EEE8158194.1 hypothetical protein [Salmonella enterica subsp. enterica serovar Badagry]EIN7308245.1 hypothetical p
MSMLKVRLKSLKNNPFAILPGRNKKKSPNRSRIDRAIHGKHTLRIIPADVREMMIERECLKVKLKKMAIYGSGESSADIIRHIEKLEEKIKGRK